MMRKKKKKEKVSPIPKGFLFITVQKSADKQTTLTHFMVSLEHLPSSLSLPSCHTHTHTHTSPTTHHHQLQFDVQLFLILHKSPFPFCSLHFTGMSMVGTLAATTRKSWRLSAESTWGRQFSVATTAVVTSRESVSFKGRQQHFSLC